jgi:hypothetical protein
MYKTFFLFFFSLLTLSCKQDGKYFSFNNDGSINNEVYSTPQTLGRSEYIEWVRKTENGLSQERTINDLDFKVSFIPWELHALKELDEKCSQVMVDKSVNEIKDMFYFTLKISSNKLPVELLRIDNPSTEEYNGRIEYYSFKMQNDIKLVLEKDTIDCSLFHFERTYNASPEATFNLGFLLPDKMKNKKQMIYPDMTMSVDENIFNTGIVNVTFKKSDLNKIPSLKI